MMQTTIVVAHGLCTPIRGKLLTAFPPSQYPNLQIAAWGEGHYHIPCLEGQTFPDSDIWVKRHIAHITVSGDDSFAKWVEYVLCRYMAANPDIGMLLMSKPLEPRNQRWAAKWDSLPPDWRSGGCKLKLPQDKQLPPPRRSTSRKQQTKQPAKPKAAKQPRHSTILDFFRRF